MVEPTSLYLYYTDYRYGFVPRGLLGTLFAPLLAVVPPAGHAGVLIAWHLGTLAALLAVLARLASRTVAGTGWRPDVLAAVVLIFCAPLIPSLAYFTAGPDVPLCLLVLGLAAAVRARRFPLAWAILAVGTLGHQLMLFLAVPVLVAGGLTRAERPLPAILASLGVALAAWGLLLLAPPADERLVAGFIEHGITPHEARHLFGLQLGQTASGMLAYMAGLWRDNAVNGAIAVAFAAAPGLPILAAALLTPGAVRGLLAPDAPRWRVASTGLLLLGLGLGPLLVLALAWDLSRLAALSTLTAFLVADVLLRRDPRQAPVPRTRSRPVAAAAWVLAALHLPLPFVGLWFGGAVLNAWVPMVPQPVLRIEATRSVIDGVLAAYAGERP